MLTIGTNVTSVIEGIASTSQDTSPCNSQGMKLGQVQGELEHVVIHGKQRPEGVRVQ